jgi:hypothetical protein
MWFLPDDQGQGAGWKIREFLAELYQFIDAPLQSASGYQGSMKGWVIEEDGKSRLCYQARI